MRNTRFRRRALSLGLVLAVPALPAVAAQSTQEPDWSVGGSVTGATDYVWRGVSQTDGDPALLLDLYAGHESGWYLGASAASVDFGDPDDGMDYELSPYIGWAGGLGAAELDVFVSRVMYPGVNDGYDIDYTEIEASLGFAEYYHVGLAYSPDIFNLGGHGWYYTAGAEWPLGGSGLTLAVQAGHYDLRDAAGDSYNDWLLGLSRGFGPVDVRLQYTDTSSYGEILGESVGAPALADGRTTLLVGWEF
ncbi:TorF family putative porin [Lysobacter sp. GX 14042]|uniref:TorF family putative porin n=1 Tax=Lysobacter sp. GX 14042 TaxID=2907155 RepID=UPI001F461715|nr:TorF family putative porin [Lysobacter sp. GX 14042]MCE7032505.1 TorF family putative porin [Lysobacter sp. GX 14042]